MAPARRPAALRQSGCSGAPCRRQNKMAASGASQGTECFSSRPAHSFQSILAPKAGGNTEEFGENARPQQAGTIASRRVARRISAPGLPRRRTNRAVSATSKKERHTLNKNLGSRAAQKMRPRSENREIKAECDRDAGIMAIVKARRKDIGGSRNRGKGADEIVRLHGSSVLNFRASAEARDATRPGRLRWSSKNAPPHRQSRRHRCNGLHDRALPGRQEFEMPADIGDKHIRFGAAVRQDFGKIIDRKRDAAAAPAQGVDHFMARDGAKPGPKGSLLIPALPLEMNGKQGFLHNILGVGISHSCWARPGVRWHEALASAAAANAGRNRHRRIARAHQKSPLLFLFLAAHKVPSAYFGPCGPLVTVVSPRYHVFVTRNMRGPL